MGPEGRMRLENDEGMGQSAVSFVRFSWSIGMMGVLLEGDIARASVILQVDYKLNLSGN